MATDVAGPLPSCLFFITDRTTGNKFLVDTGAEVSVIPPSRAERQYRRDSLTLQAANNTSIATYGKRSLTLNLGLRRTFRWIFVIADVRHPILGADFLRHYSLLVDMAQCKLSDGITHLQVHGLASGESSLNLSLLSKTTGNAYEAILRDYPAVVQPLDNQPPKHNVTHHITTSGPPVHACA